MNVIVNLGKENKISFVKGKSKYENLFGEISKILIKDLGKVVVEEKITIDEHTLGKLRIQKDGEDFQKRAFWGQGITEEDFIYNTVGNLSKIGDHIVYLATIEDNGTKKIALLELGQEIDINEFVCNDIIKLWEIGGKIYYIGVINKHKTIRCCLLEMGEEIDIDGFILSWIDQIKEVGGEIYYKAMIDNGGKYVWAWLKKGEDISIKEKFKAIGLTDIEEIGGRYFYGLKFQVKKQIKWIWLELGKELSKSDFKRSFGNLPILREDEQGKIYIEVLGWNKKKKKYYL